MLLPFFLGSTNKKNKKMERENTKNIYVSEKNILKRPKDHRRLVEEDKIYKIEKIDSVFLTDECLISKENLI
jgi:DNA-dependent RNA polymerase auxiliary subunit epsilon